MKKSKLRLSGLVLAIVLILTSPGQIIAASQEQGIGETTTTSSAMATDTAEDSLDTSFISESTSTETDTSSEATSSSAGESLTESEEIEPSSPGLIEEQPAVSESSESFTSPTVEPQVETDIAAVLEFMGHTSEDVLYIEDLYSLSGEALYSMVVFSKGGYGIFLKNPLKVMEFSNEVGGTHPYTSIVGQKGYLGPMGYFYKLDNAYYNLFDNQVITDVASMQDYENNVLSALRKPERQSRQASAPTPSGTTVPEITIPNENRIKTIPFGNNDDGTCGILAAATLLTFWDMYYDNSVVPTALEAKLTGHPLGEDQDVLHKYLVETYAYKVGGSLPEDDARLVNTFLGLDSKSQSYNAKWLLIPFNGIINSLIDRGIPVSLYGSLPGQPDLTSGACNEGIGDSNHAVVVYGYKRSTTVSLGTVYKVHYGWHDVNDTYNYNDYTVSQSAKDLWINPIYIGGIMWIEPIAAHTHKAGYVSPHLDKHGVTLFNCAEPGCQVLFPDDISNTKKWAKDIFLGLQADNTYLGKVDGNKINYPGDEDYFKIEIPYRAKVNIKAAFTSPAPPSTISLYSASHEAWVATVSTYGNVNSLQPVLEPGTYYVKVDRSIISEYNFSIAVPLASDDADGNSASTATLLFQSQDPNQTQLVTVDGARIDSAKDEDWFKFEAPIDGLYAINFGSENGRKLQAQFLDSAGKSISNKITSSGILYAPLTKGVNYIKILSPEGKSPIEYSFTLSRVETMNPAQTKNNATALSPNTPIVASIVGKDTTHWFKVTVPSAENGNIAAPMAAGIMSASSTIETDGSEVPCAFVLTGFDTSKLRLSLVNEADEVIEFKDTANKNGIIRVLLKPGDYYLQVQKMDNFDIPTMYALEFVIGTYDGQDYSFISNLLDFIMSLNDKSEDAANRNARPPVSTDPLVLDLTDTGFAPKTVFEGAYFDLNRDGFAEKINWISGGNGFLAVDKNGDGKIRNGNELFGDNTVLASGVKAKNGFEALTEFDTNKDGIVDSSDNDFGKLLVWVDANEDGISTSEELKTLTEHGIKSLSLDYELKNELTESGAVLANLSTFDREDGSVGKLGELWVISELYNTKDLDPVDLPAELTGLPDIPSIGTVYSLHKAMALDSTGRLAELVRQFSVTYDDKARMAIVEQILLIMTDSENIASDSRGPNIDAKKLNVVERFLGKPFVGRNGSNPNNVAGPMLLEVYNEFCEVYYSELIYQTHLKSLHSLFKYTNDDGKTSLLVEDLSDFLIDWVDSGKVSQQMLTDTARFIKYLGRHNIVGFDSFRTYFGIRASRYLSVIDQSVGIALMGTANADTLRSTPSQSSIYGLAGDDNLYGNDGNNTLDGDLGNNYLEGGKGSNNYIFSQDYGINTFYDIGGDATIHFGEGINPEDVKLKQLINPDGTGTVDAEIIVAGSTGKIIIKEYMSSVISQIKWFTFSNGNTREAATFFAPEEISTTEQLAAVLKNLYGNYKLIADIDLAGVNWTPIGQWAPKGTNSASFRGSFDGNGHVIKNLKVSGRAYSGLFGYNHGTLMNIELADVVIDSLERDYVGGLAGYNNGLIINCSVTGNSLVKGGRYTGGLVGYTLGVIKKSYTNCRVEGSLESGGLVGRATNLNNQNVTLIEECYTTGNIEGDTVGGLIGYLDGAKLTNSFSIGNAYGHSYGGGLVYFSNNGEIENCYTLSNTGIIGTGTPNLTTNYFNRDMLSKTISSDQVRTTNEMQAAVTYEGWDFENVWSIEEGKSYPVLKNLPSPDSNIIEVSTVEQLVDVSKNLSGSYKLMADIDLAGVTWTPIGTSATSFKGIFNGNGYVIKNLKVSERDYSGLFGYNQGRLMNVELADVVINSLQQNYVGSLAGYSSGLIINCSVTGHSSVKGGTYTGGLVGYVSGSIKQSYTECSVEGKWGSSAIGGLVGYVTTLNSQNVATIEECYTTGNIKGYSVGGIVGYLYESKMINCFSTGNAYGSSDRDGLVFGYSNQIMNCYTISDAGTSNLMNNYFNGDMLARTICSTNLRTTSEMQAAATYVGWDFENIWSIEEGKSYPILRNLPAPNSNIVEISTVEQLVDVSKNLSGNYKLMADIDLTDVIWTPIGTNIAAFAGTFDGNGYVIRNLKVYGSEYSGLFGYNQGRLMNIKLDDVVIDSLQKNYIGGLVGYSVGLITNCSVGGNSSINGSSYVGGLVGYSSSLITNCSVGGNSSINGGSYVGGLVGYAASGSISRSYTECNVKGSSEAGGLVGEADGNYSSRTVIEECYTSGTVKAYYAGGIVGNLQGAQLANCFSVGNSIGSSYGGGIAGYNPSWYGGTISNCYTVSSTGLAGYDSSGLTSCYSNSDMLSKTINSSQSRTTSEMQQLSTYIGWDFETVWSIEEGKSYPILKNLPAPRTDTVIEIASAEQLVAISENLSGKYKLVADINLSDINWTPLGTTTAPFIGSLDGDGYLIKNLKVSGQDYSGLFGYSLGKLANIKLVDIIVNSEQSDYVGGLAGYSSGKVVNCSVTGNSSIIGGSYTGGLVGYATGLINKSYTDCTVKGSYGAGGLIGRAYNSDTPSTMSVSECYTSGNISGIEAGGLIGTLEGAQLVNSFSVGNAVGSSYEGGLVGFFSSGAISKCYTLSNAGMVGDGLPDLTSSYFNGDMLVWNIASSQMKTTIEMQQVSTYPDWDFETVWSIEEGKSYPILKNLPAPNFNTTEIVSTVEVSTAEQLMAMSENLSGNYKLVADIDLAGIDWTPIGAFWEPFAGTLDGNGYSINNLNVSYKNYAGLFGYNQGNLMNVRLVNIIIESPYNYKVGGLVADNSGLISNCSVSGNSSIVGCDMTGGLVGKNSGLISNCSVIGNSTVVGYCYTGGLVGDSEGTVKKSYTECSVEGTYTTGGLVGRLYNSDDQNIAIIEACYASGNIVSNENEAGGLVGVVEGAKLTNSYSSSNLSGTYGLGGLVANFYSGEITNCYSLSNVAMVGYSALDLANCYFNGDLSQVEYLPQSRTTSEMQRCSTYEGWDFENVWSIEEGMGYPQLRFLND